MVHILDNEASAQFKEEIQKNCDLQMVPPDTHWQNLAEQAIQTFKSHFLAILAGVDPSFPMTLWDRLVPQAVLTLNLLRQAKADPKMSAYEFVHGKMDYNKMPLALLGCAVQMHESTNRQKMWDTHSLNGWYLGTSPEHYRCHNIFCTKTRAERISDTVFFQHWYLTQPVVTPADAIINAMKNLRSIIKNGPGNFEREEMDILRQMDAILQCDKKQASKHVTFTAGTMQAKPAMHDRVVHPRMENTALRPRVDNASPRVIMVAAVDEPYGPPHPMTT